MMCGSTAASARAGSSEDGRLGLNLEFQNRPIALRPTGRGGSRRIQDSVDKFSPLLRGGPRRIKNSVDKNPSFSNFFLSTAAREISLIDAIPSTRLAILWPKIDSPR